MRAIFAASATTTVLTLALASAPEMATDGAEESAGRMAIRSLSSSVPFFGRSDRGKNILPNAALTPARETIVDDLMRSILGRAVLPAATHLLHMRDPTQNPPIIVALRATLVLR